MTTQIELLKKYGLSVRGHLGQHLLIDPNMQRKIVDLLEISSKDFIFEIGPGLGAITQEILRRGARVLAVEKDKNFISILKEELSPFKGKFKIAHEDILQFDLNKIASKTVRPPFKVISNLPYYITAPILFKLIESRKLFSKAVFTMQKEVAQRLFASPGSKDYGRFTLGIQYAASAKHAFDIPPSCFTPQPEVDSSVVELVFYPEARRLKKNDEIFLFELIQTAFSQRRKTFLNLLVHDSKIKLDREKILSIFESLGISATTRGEELLLKDYMNLAEKFKTLQSKKLLKKEV